MAILFHPPAPDAPRRVATANGRSERRGEAYFVLYVEPLSDARTKPGARCVSARRGWAGEKRDFFTILLDGTHDPTATGASSFVAEEEGVPSLAARQVLHTRGRTLRNDTLPLARQL